MKWFANLPSKTIDKVALIILVSSSLYGIGLIIQGFYLIWPIYTQFRDDVAGSDLAQDADAVSAVWQSFFFFVVYMLIMAAVCAGFALYCIKIWRSAESSNISALLDDNTITNAFAEKPYSTVLINAMIWLGLLMSLTIVVLTALGFVSVNFSTHLVRFGTVLMVGGMWCSKLFRIPTWGIPLRRFTKRPRFTREQTLGWGLAAFLAAANFVLFSLVDR